MGQYPDQGYGYDKSGRGAYPMPGDASHTGMMGYGYRPDSDMYPSGSYDYGATAQGQTRPSDTSATGGKSKVYLSHAN